VLCLRRNNNCELQSLAKEYGVDFFRFGHPDKPLHEVDARATRSCAT
jgi:NADH dehydrogenase/NADH:ubiquinone oxidoreductase subunit G